MKLYNVTFRPEHKSVLVPKIPMCPMPKEDNVTPRVCLTDSISNCIQALPEEHRDVHEGATIEVREVIIRNPSKLLTPMELYTSGRVPDALENQEYWYLGNVVVRSYTTTIVSFQYKYTISWSMVSTEDINNIILNLTGRRLQGETAKAIYDLAYEVLPTDTFEALDDEIGNIPYAQKIEIQNVVTATSISGNENT